MVHPAGFEPAHAPGLSRLPLPVGLRMRWSDRQALLLPPPAWRAGALLNELLSVGKISMRAYKSRGRVSPCGSHQDLNLEPALYKSVALPMSYVYAQTVGARSHALEPLAGLEPAAIC